MRISLVDAVRGRPDRASAVAEADGQQLEKAIEVVMEELRKNPPPVLKRPPYPDYQKDKT